MPARGGYRMANFKAEEGAISIEFSAILDGYKRPDALKITNLVASDGTVYRYRWGSTQRHEITVNNISLADANAFNSWWLNNTRIHFTPDLVGAPAVTFAARIVNETKPMQMFNYAFGTLYEGTIIIQQVPSGS